MFGKKVEKSMEIDSLIGENIKLTGKIEGKGNLRIDGIIEGDIVYEGDVIIGETGKVQGNIHCRDISLAGTVEGNIKAKEKLTLHTTGKLMGDAEVANLIVHEDAFFQGSCKMTDKKVKQIESTTKK
ncbi:polymer-forming cytoskeletal protein [Schnuerera sp.]|uniref:bactofilin family protein n=1 Tax=Schnuerera sp. TaxID=2794844 RepID=UPI002C25428C|nr:polymer-forming cytoskeletal protein [Schnuerera sp.]HSH36279.1 polymer-forming cytoskeletal protein [Schnuerera sp.]